jgi:hypothetical protein
MNQLTGACFDATIEAYESRPSPLALVQLEHLHGEVHRTHASQSAVTFRNAQYSAAFATLEAHTSGRAYVNHLSDASVDRGRAAYGPSLYDRLARVEQRYDPDNLFCINQDIQPNRARVIA